MRKLLIWGAMATLLVAFVVIRHAPYTIAAAGTPSPLIVIDPGHGGRDPGAIRGTIYEKSLTLAVGLKLGALLQQKGIRVYYTRTQDTALSGTVVKDLTARAHLANRLGATLFVSIHVNAEPSGTMAGPLVYYTRSSFPSLQLATLVSQHLQSLGWPYRPPRPIRQWVLAASQMPAINVEIGFLTHPQDTSHMLSSPYQSRLAYQIALGLTQYINRP